MKLLRIIASLFFSATFLFTAATAQESQPTHSELYLEVTCCGSSQPDYQPVPDANKPSGGWYAAFRRIDGAQPSMDVEHVRAVNIVSRIDGVGAHVYVSVFMGRRVMENEVLVADYLLQEHQKVVVDELRRFGLEPFGIAVVRVETPRSDGSNLPRVMSQAPSISVASLEPAESATTFYKLKLKNSSSKNVSALQINVLFNNRREASAMPQGEDGRMLIEAGGVYDAPNYGLNSIRNTGGVYRQTFPPNQTVVITTAVFDDGTYEGDAEEAARFLAYVIGRKKQVSRIVSLLNAASESSDAEGLNRLKMQATALGIEAEVSEADALMKKFPDFNERTRDDLKRCIEIALSNVKKKFLEDIAQYESERASVSRPFKEWLDASRERYGAWLSRLQSYQF